MMYMFKDLLDVLIEHKLAIRQYFILELLYYKANTNPQEADRLMKDYTEAAVIPDTDGKRLLAGKDEVDDLVNRNWLIKDILPNGKYTYRLNQNMVGLLFLDVETAGDAFYNVYPSFVTIDHKSIPLKSGDRWAAYTKYWKLIRGRLQEHNEVILDIKWGVENELISMNIIKFIDSMYWKELRPMRLANTIDFNKKGQSHLLDYDFLT